MKRKKCECECHAEGSSSSCSSNNMFPTAPRKKRTKRVTIPRETKAKSDQIRSKKQTKRVTTPRERKAKSDPIRSAIDATGNRISELMNFKRPSTKSSKSRAGTSWSTRTRTSTWKSTAASHRVFDVARILATSPTTLDLDFQQVLAGIKEITFVESVEVYKYCQKDAFAFNQILFCNPEERASTAREIIKICQA